MLESVFTGTTSAVHVSIAQFLLCAAVSLVLGLGLAFLYRIKSAASQSFMVTLAILPVVVQVIILLVNGQVGTAVAVMGAFSLVRFRSMAGSAREITGIFIAMAIGLATGMGYIGLAALFFAIAGGALTVYTCLNLGGKSALEKQLKITIPESLEYESLFDDIFARYTQSAELETARTTNMGSLYELRYTVRMKAAGMEKDMIDALRCRNGNLTISLHRMPESREAL